jgi:hypothetical protein
VYFASKNRSNAHRENAYNMKAVNASVLQMVAARSTTGGDSIDDNATAFSALTASSAVKIGELSISNYNFNALTLIQLHHHLPVEAVPSPAEGEVVPVEVVVEVVVAAVVVVVVEVVLIKVIEAELMDP